MTQIEEASEDELVSILEFFLRRSEATLPRVLVGGWAVFAYNPYSKSVDIDLVLSSKDRRLLVKWLCGERGYIAAKVKEEGWRGAHKAVPGVGEIIVDLASFEESQRFENRQDELGFDLTIEHNMDIRIGGLRAAVPTRSLLLLYKMKAAWDRGQRIADGRSLRPDWETAKLHKDRSDILALIDPNVNAPWDLGFLGRRLMRHTFLLDVLHEVILDKAASERYGIPKREGAHNLEALLSLLGMDR